MPDRGRRRWSVFDAIAASLILLAPFVVFVKHNGYPFLALETVLLYAGFAVVGGGLSFAAAAGGRVTSCLLIAFLVTLFVDVQFAFPVSWNGHAAVFVLLFVLTWFLRDHASRILSAVFATVVLSSLVGLVDGDGPIAPVQARPAAVASAPATDLPVLVYLILDEHIGIEGIPSEIESAREVKEKLVSFYLSNGFRLFGRAYSEYYNSFNSLSHVVNFSPGWYDGDLISLIDANYKWQMSQNKLLRRLRNLGFRVQVYQSTYLSFCEDGQVIVEPCEVGSFTSLEPFSHTPLL